MKRTVIPWMAAVALGVLALGGNPASAQGPIQQTNASIPTAPPRTKLAVINLQQAIKGYLKWQEFEKAYKDYYGRYDAEFNKKKEAALQLKSQLDKTTDEASREKIQAQLRELDRQVQDLGEDAKKNLSKYRDEQAVQIYREVEQAVQVYARANDLEMVLHFNDAIAPADLYHAANIQRKLQTGACMPMYVAPGMDITGPITQMLNQRLGAPAAPAAAGQQN